MIVYLERIDPEKNACRFYRAAVRPTLFGDWVLIREWGRIGSPRGQRMEQWFGEQAQAIAACERLVAVKRRRGYGQDNLQNGLSLSSGGLSSEGRSNEGYMTPRGSPDGATSGP